MCVCVCVCVRERERERESDSLVCVSFFNNFSFISLCLAVLGLHCCTGFSLAGASRAALFVV